MYRKRIADLCYQSTSFLNHLSHAIRHDELCLHYQPRYNTVTGKSDVLEALVRWQRPNDGLLYPEAFISHAENNGLIFRLDMWVFEHCCKDLLWLHNNFYSHAKISINISVQACENICYLQKIIKISDKYGVHLSNFEFDITRCAHAYDIRKITSFCEAMNNFGVNFRLDDFATGPSPTAKLWSLAHATIINKCFIHDIGKSADSEDFIRSLVEKAKDIRVRVIAEGIESKEQRIFMSDLGCDHLQGFLLCRPLSVTQIKRSMMYAPG